MMRIPLSRDRVVVVDDIDADLAAHYWSLKRYKSRPEYAYRRIGNSRTKCTTIYMHRVIAARMGLNIDDRVVDHIDGNGLNNQRSNLRVASHSQSMCNTKLRTDSASGYRGVSLCRRTGRWTAWIEFQHKKHWLGRHATPELAANAYRAAARRLHGEFQRTSTERNAVMNKCREAVKP